MNDPHLLIEEVRACRARLGDRVLTTPTHNWRGPRLAAQAGGDVEVFIKLELFQLTGSFKPRGALNVISSLTPEELARGVTAASGGNHAIAVAYAAQAAGASAKVVMPRTASPIRMAMARSYGAEVVLSDSIATVFAMAEAIRNEEGRTFVHPFEGPLTAQGTATVALEFSDQAGPLDVMIVPIGGGGLIGGMAAAMKQLQPDCRVIGVEPEGADSMYRSFAAGSPQKIEAVRTIADSLGAPMALPYSFALCRANVDELVLVSDDDLRRAMKLLFEEMKLAVEPAGAAATAALTGPLRGRFAGRRVGIIACGANIDAAAFCGHLAAAEG
jgi:threonine dehydratase